MVASTRNVCLGVGFSTHVPRRADTVAEAHLREAASVTRAPGRLHDYFERQVRSRPDAIAVEHIEAKQRLSYSELNERGTRLASHLQALGVGPGKPVALFLPRGVDQYVSMLAVLLSGGAYVPIDAETPAERARFTVQDCGASVVLTDRTLVEKISGAAPHTLMLDDLDWTAEPEPRLLARAEPSAEDVCYIIYTSGTTGRPKGVCISHRNATAFVEAMLAVYGVRRDDRVLQGFSTAFDASVEEIWMAFATGATLVVGALETMRAVDELSAKLRAWKISVLSTVPTLLSVLDNRNLPRLRLVISGGEALRADLIERWARKGRSVLNTYGPTETTVVATSAWCRPGEPVTIGQPLPGYTVTVLDPHLCEVPDGEEGELCVGGPAVSSHGYLHLPDLNAEKFFEREGKRFYHTGDLVSRNARGDLEFRGRIDTQVKIRGYRIELTEIETHLVRAVRAQAAGAGCQGVIVAARADDAGTPQLVAYLLEREPATIDAGALRAELRRTLPAHMVPSHIVALDPAAVPRLTSGKVNRLALPAPSACRSLSASDEPDRSGEEDPAMPGDAPPEPKIVRIFRRALEQPSLTATDSFFDLGGNSVLAAKVVTRFRQDPDLSRLAIRDLYQHPTARELAGILGARARGLTERTAGTGSSVSGGDTGPGSRPVSRAQYLLAGGAQGLILFALLALAAYTIYGMVEALLPLWEPLRDTASAGSWALLTLGLFVGLPAMGLALTLLWALVCKALRLGYSREGDYAIWSWGYVRWWLGRPLTAPVQAMAAAFVGTPLAPFFYRFLGAKIGKRVYLATGLDEPNLVTIDEGASIAAGAILRTHALDGGLLKLRPVRIGRDCFVGGQSIVAGGARLADGAKLHPLSYLGEDAATSPGSEWRGSPAAEVPPGSTALSRLLDRHEREPQPGDDWGRSSTALRITLWQFLYAYAYGLVRLVPAAGQIALWVWLEISTKAVTRLDLSLLLPASVFFAALGFASKLGTIIAAKWILSGRARAGTISLSNREFARRWFCGRVMSFLVDPRGTRGVAETIFMPTVCRALGMRVGKQVEISDASGFQPDLVSIGDGAMLADRCYLGAPVVHRGRMTLGATQIGERSFIANASHVPITTPVVPAESLVGVLSIPPDDPPPASDWLGSPPMRLPNRTRSQAPLGRTFTPPRHLVLARAFCNLWKMILPGALVQMHVWTSLKVIFIAYSMLNTGAFLAVLPFLFVGLQAALLFLPVAVKWILVGRYKRGERFLWSFWMWRMEIVYEVELRVRSHFDSLIDGTPLFALWYRTMGSRLGRQVCIYRGFLMEADLVRLGDRVSIEGFLQTHLFEDRVMKLGPVVIEDDCSVGTEACVLYDSRMANSSRLGDLSLILKHEMFPPNERYRGLPAERAADAPLRLAA